MIHPPGFLVTLYSSYFANLLVSLVFESAMVGSNLLEIFGHASLVSPYFLDFLFSSLSI